MKNVVRHSVLEFADVSDSLLGDSSFLIALNGKVVKWISDKPPSGYHKLFGDGSRG